MPQIFDNIEKKLLDALRVALQASERADFCVGYFNLRGWRKIDAHIAAWKGGEGRCCRLLVGMQQLPQEQLRSMLSLNKDEERIDNGTALALKKKLAEEFREQLSLGLPSAEDQAGLRRLAKQLKGKKLLVKLFLRNPLHAKLYLLFRQDQLSPTIGYLGSSNLTLAGLRNQGELNVDVLDHDACNKLTQWFEDRWNDRFCLDISDELADIIDASWARETPIPPYHIYIKMAYHLSQEARDGLTEFHIPADFGDKLFAFQKAAVQIAAHHLNKRGGVVIGDVVGLGKTLMACALARIFEDDHGIETLILCPKNLVAMWEDYAHQYRLRARVLPITRVQKELPNLRRYRLVLIDESHNLRNREGARYRAISDYINTNQSRVILLSATPYNKSYLDLSSQLRLFIGEHQDLGIRPERFIRELGETEFSRRHQCPLRSLAAFEKSPYADDWRDLMRLYLVRRTRSFIEKNYAQEDPENGRKYLEFADGGRSYFPQREPKTVKFNIAENNPDDQYARLFSDAVVETVNNLRLPRYGLGNYKVNLEHVQLPAEEAQVLSDLSRAGMRLKGFCRTNLFKRLESSGHAFILSVERHIMRNFIYLHAIEQGLPLPIGTQDMGLLDSWVNDQDDEFWEPEADNAENGGGEPGGEAPQATGEDEIRSRAAAAYENYASTFKNRFKWLRSELFSEELANELREDANALLALLQGAGAWDKRRDSKLLALVDLLREKHPEDKVLVFSQFADTVDYLADCLKAEGFQAVEAVSGNSDNPTDIAHRFSPRSNGKGGIITPEQELRVVLSTDVLSEGQNLQDCAVIVNYDLPWAIIRLIQRAGRVDRIGQKAEQIMCYSFLPADGVERIIKLRSRVRSRLQENAEVVGADELFFEDQDEDQVISDLYSEKAGILNDAEDGEDTEVDLASYAYQIWKNAVDKDPALAKSIPAMPNLVFSAKAHQPSEGRPEGALVYLRSGEGSDALAWVNQDGVSVSESQFAILKAAECAADSAALEPLANHHKLVAEAVRLLLENEQLVGGQLGRPSGARFRTYERLKAHALTVRDSLFDTAELRNAIDDIYQRPLVKTASESLNRQLRSGVSNEELASSVISLRAEGRLCLKAEEGKSSEPQLVCSLGLRKPC